MTRPARDGTRPPAIRRGTRTDPGAIIRVELESTHCRAACGALHPIHRFVEWDLPFVIICDPGLAEVDLSSELTYASTMVSADRLPVETLRAHLAGTQRGVGGSGAGADQSTLISGR